MHTRCPGPTAWLLRGEVVALASPMKATWRSCLHTVTEREQASPPPDTSDLGPGLRDNRIG